MRIRITDRGLAVCRLIEEAEARGVELSLEEADALYLANRRQGLLEHQARRRRLEAFV